LLYSPQSEGAPSCGREIYKNYSKVLTKNYKSHPWASPSFQEGYFYLPAWISAVLLLAMSGSSTLFQPQQDKGRTRIQSKKPMATLPTREGEEY